MLLVFLGGTAEDKKVVKVGEVEIYVFQNVVPEVLKCSSGVSQTKGHDWELK
jgi:hypothetical protein